MKVYSNLNELFCSRYKAWFWFVFFLTFKSSYKREFANTPTFNHDFSTSAEQLLQQLVRIQVKIVKFNCEANHIQKAKYKQIPYTVKKN